MVLKIDMTDGIKNAPKTEQIEIPIPNVEIVHQVMDAKMHKLLIMPRSDHIIKLDLDTLEIEEEIKLQ